ncbi:MAG: adenylate/guanylate cyclase domain-containing protein [Chloroflexi bacterium]|nr:adenylate/guanylate cyclase domain-containing protein [Chloroflexota bacterium]
MAKDPTARFTSAGEFSAALSAAAQPDSGNITRGFLFADLRGYTAYVEAHGDTAASGLLDTYRRLMRDTIARHGGAEIKTEGDSFYVVFPSARSRPEGYGCVATYSYTSDWPHSDAKSTRRPSRETDAMGLR